jgi:siroheme synthase (precorrin-2 oxidase/ferrochelatase)
MADPIEDKGFLTERLEEDRQRMAIQVSQLKKEYNLANRLRASIQKYPQPWIMGALLTGFILSRLPARRKEVYLWSDPLQRKPPREVHPSGRDKADSSLKRNT